MDNEDIKTEPNQNDATGTVKAQGLMSKIEIFAPQAAEGTAVEKLVAAAKRIDEAVKAVAEVEGIHVVGYSDAAPVKRVIPAPT